MILQLPIKDVTMRHFLVKEWCFDLCKTLIIKPLCILNQKHLRETQQHFG